MLPICVLYACIPLANSANDGFAHVTSEEGIRGLYRGFGAVTVGGIPATVLYLGTYEVRGTLFSGTRTGRATHRSMRVLAERLSS